MTTTVLTESRIDRVQSMLDKRNLDLLIAAPGSDMAYLMGYFGHVSERPALLMIPRGAAPVIVMAAFESKSLPTLDNGVEVLTYGETQDGFDLATSAARSFGGRPMRIAVSDGMWARFLLRLQSVFAGSTFEHASGYLRDFRMRKDPEELARLRSAAERADRALEESLKAPVAGQTERQVASRLANAMQGGGLTDTWAIVGSGPNGASPHHLTGDRQISEGDTVVLDFGGTFRGYQADMTRTVCVGGASSEVRSVYAAVRSAEQAGVDASRPGARCESVDHAARSIIETAGYGDAFLHRTGHGIGLDVHEDPYIVQGNDLTLEAGMTHSVEPGIYLEGRFGVRIEDIVVVTEDGCDRLNHFSRELLTVD